MRALLDPALRERLGANARKAVEPLTPEAMTLELVLLYRELLAASVARRRGPGAPAAAPQAAPAHAPSTSPVTAAPASQAPAAPAGPHAAADGSAAAPPAADG